MSTSKKVILIALVALLLVAAAGLFVLYRMRSAEQSPAEAAASAAECAGADDARRARQAYL